MAKSTKSLYNTAMKNLNSYGSFNYNGVYDMTAENQYNDMMNNPAKYGYNRYITDVNSLYDKVMNQEKFSYDPQQDQLFQMYKQQYQNQGQRAMQNAMGVAAAASGGYNSSAAQTAAQSTYQGYMDALSNKAAETYQNALDMYKYNQQQLLNKYNTAKSMNDFANDTYYKQLEIKGNDANRAYQAFIDDRNFQYGAWSDNRNNALQTANMLQSQLNADREYELTKKLYKGK